MTLAPSPREGRGAGQSLAIYADGFTDHHGAGLPTSVTCADALGLDRPLRPIPNYGPVQLSGMVPPLVLSMALIMPTSNPLGLA
jgi:hypothetical protein